VGTGSVGWVTLNQQSGPFLCVCAIEFVLVYDLLFLLFDRGAFTVCRAESVAGNAGAILVAFFVFISCCFS